MSRLLPILSTLATLVVFISAFCAIVDRSANFAFDNVEIKAVAKRGIDKAQAKYNNNATAEQVIMSVINEATTRYPDDTQYSGAWLYNNAGGAMGKMTVLHSSFSEYLIIFGSTVGTEGHTGRFFAEDFFNIIYGEQWADTLTDIGEREVYRPGDVHYLRRGTVKQYKFPNECFALEYARGNIMSMMAFGLADAFTSTLDVPTIIETMYESGGRMLLNLLRGKI